MYETITTNAATRIQPRTGNWGTRGAVAAGRGVALAGLTLVGLVLRVVFATAVALAPLASGSRRSPSRCGPYAGWRPGSGGWPATGAVPPSVTRTSLSQPVAKDSHRASGAGSAS